jgi:hypothetical protein
MGKNLIHGVIITTVFFTSSCGNTSTTIPTSNKGAEHISEVTAGNKNHNSKSNEEQSERQVMETPPYQDEFSQIPDCASLQSKSYDEVSNLFEKHFPAALIDPGRVENVSLTQNEISLLAAFAACAAAKTDFEPFVADGATAFFGSKKHGNTAFSALESTSRKPGFEGKAAKEFAEQMRNYVKDPAE